MQFIQTICMVMSFRYKFIYKKRTSPYKWYLEWKPPKSANEKPRSWSSSSWSCRTYLLNCNIWNISRSQIWMAIIQGTHNWTYSIHYMYQMPYTCLKRDRSDQTKSRIKNNAEKYDLLNDHIIQSVLNFLEIYDEAGFQVDMLTKSWIWAWL